ncbi:MAG TPA: transferase [Shewanella frigidimarina]|nr:transferase [Shewanella frigidimarina]
MKKLYLVGAGGFAREIYSYLLFNKFIYNGYKLAGFLSDNTNDLNNYPIKHEIFDEIRSTKLTSDDAIIIAVADCKFKESIYSFYKAQNVNILTYIHGTAFIGHNVTIEDGSVVCPYAILTSDVRLGKAVTVNVHASIGHDAVLGDYSTLSGHCDVTGGVELESKVFTGSHSLVIPKVKVGEGAIIGAGSVVISKVKAGSTMFGNPAKKIK